MSGNQGGLAVNVSSKKAPKFSEQMRMFGWMLSFLKPYKGKVALFLLCNLIVSFSELFLYRTFQTVLDKVIPDKNMQLLFGIVAFLGMVIALRYVAVLSMNLLERIIRENASKDIQAAVFRQLRHLGFAYSERHPVGETLSMLNTDVAAIQTVYRWHLPSLVYQSLMFFVALFFIMVTDPLLAICTVPFYFLYYIVSPRIDKQITYWARTRADRMSHWNKQVYDNVSGIKEIRSYGREEWDISRLIAKQKPLIESNLKTTRYFDYRGFVRRVTSIIGMAVAYSIAAVLYQRGEITVGEFVAFSFFYIFLMTSMAMIVSTMAEIMVTAYQGEKVKNFLDLQPEVVETEQPILISEIKGEVEFRNVSFGYTADRWVLKDFSLKIESGQRAAFVGKSGSGKSTSLKLLNRFYDPLFGEILVDGVPLNQFSLKQLRESIGMVMQEMYLFGASVADNIRFGNPAATVQQLEEAAKAAFAHDFIMQLEHGYDTLIGERGVGLSGGQRQRICIARMMIKNPSIVLLDEATSALDNESEAEVQLALDRLLVGRTTFTVAHRLSTIRHYDVIIVMDDGMVVEKGTYDDLMSRKGALYRLVHDKAAEGRES